jgi:hypothetical protein
MKRVQCLIVQIGAVTPPDDEFGFSEEKILRAAKAILAAGGACIKPPIVKRNGMDSYTLIDGWFELCAYQKAKELDRLCESMDAYVVDAENESAIMEQLQVFA